MNMIQLKARIEAAHKAGTIDAPTAQRAYAAIYEKSYYGNTMTPKRRDSLLTNRFGI